MAILPKIISSILLLAGLVPAQPSPTGEPETPDRPRRGERRERRQRDRDFAQRYRASSADEQEKLRNERLIERTARMYELSEDQKQLVRTEIESMQMQRRTTMGPDAAEYDKLRAQMFDFWTQRAVAEEQGGSRENNRESVRRMRRDPEFAKLRDRLEEFERKYPIDWEASAKRIESLLPPEQAARGRQRREARQERWESRRAERDARRAAQRQENAATAGPESARSPSAAQAPAVSPANVAVLNPPPANVHPWEKYVRDYIKEHAFSEAQATSAMAILKDTRTRAGQIETTLAPRLEEARKISDPAARKAREEELNRPIEQLFEELKARMAGLLTVEQRKLAGS